MNPKDATRLISHLLGMSFTPAQQKDIELVMDMIITRQVPVQKSTVVKAEPNDLPPEDNTISLQDVEHFEMPSEINVQMEGEDVTRKIKIFPDGMSEAPPTETAGGTPS